MDGLELMGMSRLAELVFPNVVEHTVHNLMLPCLMLSQHAAAKDKQNYETGQVSELKLYSQMKSDEMEDFPLK